MNLHCLWLFTLSPYLWLFLNTFLRILCMNALYLHRFYFLSNFFSISQFPFNFITSFFIIICYIHKHTYTHMRVLCVWPVCIYILSTFSDIHTYISLGLTTWDWTTYKRSHPSVAVAWVLAFIWVWSLVHFSHPLWCVHWYAPYIRFVKSAIFFEIFMAIAFFSHFSTSE